jgi:hypothetical protein
MSLASKAIPFLYCEDCDSFNVTGLHSADHCVKRVKMISLEEAQKAVDTGKDEQFIQDGKAAAFQINKLKAKIVEANKILDENCEGEECYYRCRLREVLKK